MKYENTKNDISLDVSAKYEETVRGFPFDKKDQMYHNHFLITVSNVFGSETFDFYGSANDCEKGKKVLDDEGLKSALRCIVSDALSGGMDFGEFCSEYGYDEDSCTSHRIYKECEKTSGKFQNVLSNEDDWYTIVNDLNEY